LVVSRDPIHRSRGHQHTSNAGEKLTGEILDLAVGKWYEVVALQEVEYALAEQVHDNADVASVVETVPQVNTSIPILFVVGLESCQDSKLDLTSVAVFLHRANDLDGDKLVPFLIFRLYHLAECALAKKPDHLVCTSG